MFYTSTLYSIDFSNVSRHPDDDISRKLSTSIIIGLQNITDEHLTQNEEDNHADLSYGAVVSHENLIKEGQIIHGWFNHRGSTQH